MLGDVHVYTCTYKQCNTCTVCRHVLMRDERRKEERTRPNKQTRQSMYRYLYIHTCMHVHVHVTLHVRRCDLLWRWTFGLCGPECDSEKWRTASAHMKKYMYMYMYMYMNMNMCKCTCMYVSE